TAAEVGIIESIQLKNFMCHSMLGPFKFGSNVNFVVGNNGNLMAKRKEENFFSPENAKRPRQEELDDFDKDECDEDECAVSFTNGTSTL
ncbi:hypothetical protein Celaphus_00005315, partial [Cervus elaphus hippelaphus]